MIKYAISDPAYLNPDDPHPYLKQAEVAGANFFLYRDKGNLEYMYHAKKIMEAARQYPFEKIFVHRDMWLVPTLGADGVHLSAQQLEDIPKAKSMGITVIYSVHTFDEAVKAEKLGADMVTLSPVLQTPHKGDPLGFEKLKEIVGSISIPVIALGGILTQEDIEAVESSGAAGFASIRYFS